MASSWTDKAPLNKGRSPCSNTSGSTLVTACPINSVTLLCFEPIGSLGNATFHGIPGIFLQSVEAEDVYPDLLSWARMDGQGQGRKLLVIDISDFGAALRHGRDDPPRHGETAQTDRKQTDIVYRRRPMPFHEATFAKKRPVEESMTTFSSRMMTQTANHCHPPCLRCPTMSTALEASMGSMAAPMQSTTMPAREASDLRPKMKANTTRENR